MDSKRRNRCTPQRGISLVEVTVSALLVGVLLVAALNAVGAVFKTRLAARQRQQGEALARELMAEIFKVSYSDPEGGTGFGPDAGETGPTRAAFDDVDDYHEYLESPPADKDGNLLPGYDGWSRQVTVERVEPLSLEPASDDTGLLRITVRATCPAGAPTTLQAFRSSAGALEFRPPIDQTYVTAVRATLQTDADLTLTGKTAVISQARD